MNIEMNSAAATTWLVIITVAIIGGCSSGENKGLNGARQTSILEVDYAVLEPELVANVIEVTGTLLPQESAELTTQATGKVESILFKEGQKVAKGDILLQLDSREWRAQLSRLQAELEIAQKDLERKEELASIKGVSESELEAAQLKEASLQATIEETNVRLSYATIKAPFSGKIGLRKVSPGSFVSAGTSVATLVQDHPLKVEFSVPERYAGKIRTGQVVSFEVNPDEERSTATIYAAESALNQRSRALAVRASTPNPNGELIAGSFANIEVVLDSIPDAFMIPTEAIVPQLDEQIVYRIKNGKAEEVNVKTGVRLPELIQISGDIQRGDTIMLTGLLQVRDGMPVAGTRQVSKTISE